MQRIVRKRRHTRVDIPNTSLGRFQDAVILREERRSVNPQRGEGKRALTAQEKRDEKMDLAPQGFMVECV